MTAENELEQTPKMSLPLLAGGALGVVFGDIGTSPLYTLKTVLYLSGDAPSAPVILGLLSLIFWTLVIVTSLKYAMFAMRIDNRGEGGIMALMSLLVSKKSARPMVVFAGLFGAALIYGDGAITPAISVLSALEGLNIVLPESQPYILPAAVVILVSLFAIQPLGTARIGKVFGPIMALWFFSIAALGIWGIIHHPAVLMALNPLYGIHFLFSNGVTSFLVLGGVFLCVTGAEALYADMGHFGKKTYLARLVRHRVPQFVAELCRAGRADPLRRRRDPEYFFPPVPADNANTLGDPGYPCHHHRQPGDHQRGLFHDPSGDPAWLVAALAGEANHRGELRPNLHRCHQLAADGGDGLSDGVLQILR